MPSLSIRASNSPVHQSTAEEDVPPLDLNEPSVCRPELNPPERRSSSRSSRSRSRSPRRSRRDRHSQRRRRIHFKRKERNFPAAVCSMIVIVMLCTALVEPDWFYMRGGGCSNKDKHPKHNIGAYEFFYAGHFVHEGQKLVYHYSSNNDDVLVDCVNPRAVQVLQSVIALCFIGILFSLMGFFLDLTGPNGRMMKIIRRNAVCNILTVVVCVTINGFSFLVTQLLHSLQEKTKLSQHGKVEIRFDVSFYLIAAAGALSVVSAACNLLKRYPPTETVAYMEQRVNLLEDYDGWDLSMAHHAQSPDYYAPINYMPPPPAYTP